MELAALSPRSFARVVTALRCRRADPAVVVPRRGATRSSSWPRSSRRRGTARTSAPCSSSSLTCSRRPPTRQASRRRSSAASSTPPSPPRRPPRRAATWSSVSRQCLTRLPQRTCSASRWTPPGSVFGTRCAFSLFPTTAAPCAVALDATANALAADASLARRRPPGELARRPWRTRRWRGRMRRCGWSWHRCAHTCPGRCSTARGPSRRRRRHRLGRRRKRHSWGRSWHECGRTCLQRCTTARGAGRRRRRHRPGRWRRRKRACCGRCPNKTAEREG